MRMVQSVEIRDGGDGVPNFPGPLTLIPSLKKRWNLLIGAGTFTIASILFSFGVGVSFGDRIMGVLTMIFFGYCTVMGVIALLPGSSSLRLDGNGFDITRFFYKQQFRWSAVSDFGIWTYRVWPFEAHRTVVFKAARPRLGMFAKINAALTSGRICSLPTIFRTEADDLLQLMTTWRNSALNATNTGS
jgi:hypothetical protein